jgi:4-hydroxybenzoate synthetase (chorismate lyase)
MRDKRMSPELRTWLYASGSLTQQLTDFAQGVFKVEPSIEQFQRMTLQDARWLQMPIQHTAWVRESYLYGCEAEPWVKAKSIFPILSIQGVRGFFSILVKNPSDIFYFSVPIRSVSGVYCG